MDVLVALVIITLEGISSGITKLVKRLEATWPNA
jgi:hypothetical protein